MKYLKIITLLSTLMGIGVSVYYKLYLLTVFLVLLLFYFLHIFMKKREYHRANNFNKRTILASNVILFVVLLIVVRLTQVQLFNYETYEKKAIEQIRKNDKSYGNRGNIFDSNGKSLAFNKNIYMLGINPSAIYDNEDNLKGIEKILDEPYIRKNKEKLLREIKEGYEKDRKYKVIAKNLSEKQKEKIQEIVKKYKNNLPQCFFVSGDEKAIVLIRELFNIGIKVPEDIKVMGFDNLPLSQYTIPSLTTVSMNYKELAEKLLTKLLNIMDNKPEISEEIESKLIIRESTI